MIALCLALAAILDDPAVSSGPPAEIATWVSVLTGSGGALVSLGLWVRALIAEKKDMVAAHRDKDAQLVSITREAIACIQASVARSDTEGSHRARLESLLLRIEGMLADLDRPA